MPAGVPDRRNALTPEALRMIDVIARSGSFAAAARELGKVPSALTYGVRQLEEALDVLLFDRRSRQAKLTPAGLELLSEGRRLLEQLDDVANRVHRVGSGRETQLSIAVDSIICNATVLDLCEAFYLLNPPNGPGTRLRLRSEVLAGTWEALVTGLADLAIGVFGDHNVPPGVTLQPLGELNMRFVVAPRHPLAKATEPLSDAELVHHRAIAVADSAQRLAPITVNLLSGQDVFTLPSVPAKLDALLRGLGCDFMSEALVNESIRAGRLVAKAVVRSPPLIRLQYAWRTAVDPHSGRRASLGMGLQWWLQQLENGTTRNALLNRTQPLSLRAAA